MKKRKQIVDNPDVVLEITRDKHGRPIRLSSKVNAKEVKDAAELGRDLIREALVLRNEERSS